MQLWVSKAEKKPKEFSILLMIFKCYQFLNLFELVQQAE